MNKYLKLHSDVFLTKGKNRSVIFDFNKKKLEYIPNSMYDFLITELSQKKKYIRKSKKKDKIINEYLNFIIKNEYGFYTDTPKLFPKIDEEVTISTILTNGIIDIDKSISFKTLKITIDKLSNINCPHIQLRIFDVLTIKKIQQIFSFFEGNTFRSIELIMQFTSEKDVQFILSLFQKYPALLKIVISNSKYDKRVITNRFNILEYTKNEIINEFHCGFIHPNRFILTKDNYLLGKKYNSCLFGKISVNKYGQIKNCPAFKDSYGHIVNTDLNEIVYDNFFQEKWMLNKDSVNECKVCELRYVCSDCRAITKNNSIKNKPKYCNYEI